MSDCNLTVKPDKLAAILRRHLDALDEGKIQIDPFPEGNGARQRFNSINILQLPQSILEHIFSFLSYKEIGVLREVCQKLNDICGSMMNRGFQNVLSLIPIKMKKFQHGFKFVASPEEEMVLIRKIIFLQMLRSELRVLQALCWKYVETGACIFTGGALIDEYLYNVSEISNARSSLKKIELRFSDRIFRLGKSFLDHFEDNVEPQLEKVSTFGSKIVDLLNCSLTSTCQLSVTHDSHTFNLQGVYQVRCWKSMRPPKDITNMLEDQSTIAESILSKYLRNVISRNNYFMLKDKEERLFKMTFASNPLNSLYIGKFLVKERSVSRTGTYVYTIRRKLHKEFDEMYLNLERMDITCHIVLQCHNQNAPSEFSFLFLDKRKLLEPKTTADKYHFSLKMHFSFPVHAPGVSFNLKLLQGPGNQSKGERSKPETSKHSQDATADPNKKRNKLESLKQRIIHPFRKSH